MLAQNRPLNFFLCNLQVNKLECLSLVSLSSLMLYLPIRQVANTRGEYLKGAKLRLAAAILTPRKDPREKHSSLFSQCLSNREKKLNKALTINFQNSNTPYRNCSHTHTQKGSWRETLQRIHLIFKLYKKLKEALITNF